MFFIISKILSFIIVPFFWILILLFWYLISKSKNNKRRIKITIIIIAILFSNDFIYREAIMRYQSKPTEITQEKTFSACILLGGISGYDKYGKGHWGEGSDRFIQTEKLYHQGIIQKIVLSGGSGNILEQGLKEADFMKEELIASGVKETDIIIENNSRNTFENAVFSKQLLDNKNIKGPYLLITSALHMPRSEKVFNKAGLNIVPYPCDYREFPEKFEWVRIIVPNIKRLSDWQYLIKEIIGLKVYQLTGKA